MPNEIPPGVGAGRRSRNRAALDRKQSESSLDLPFAKSGTLHVRWGSLAAEGHGIVDRSNQLSRFIGSVVLSVGLLVGVKAQALTITLGEQDFTDGSIVGFSAFNSASAGEAAPFDQFRGHDILSPFSATWTFDYLAQTASIASASITLGITDHDSQGTGSQIASFSLDGRDITGDLDALFEASGGAQLEYNVYTLSLADSVLAELVDGTASFSLDLQGPGSLSSNGAGLDFATLYFSTDFDDPIGSPVPEPHAFVLFTAGALVIGAAVRKKAFRRD